MEQLTVRNLTFSYHNNNGFALHNISFDVAKGEVLLMIGESGCGKTTLLRHLKPAIMPVGERKAGCEILLNGVPMERLRQREQVSKIGYVSQNVEGMQATDRVCHELAFGLESLGYTREQMNRRVAEMTAFFGLEEIYDKKLSDLSGGQKQLVNLASVMAMEPELLLLDEPTSQLDPIATDTFYDMLKKLRQELGTTIILTEHRLEEAFLFCDRVLVMERGRILLLEEKKLAADKLFSGKHIMYYALPTPARMFLELEGQRGESPYDGSLSEERERTMPLNVAEGKAYIEYHYKKHKESETILERHESKGTERTLSKDKVGTHKRKTQKKMTAMETEELWFRYGRETPDVLKGCDISFEKGKITAILGGNGTGKSTLLYVLAGRLKPYIGKVKKSEGKIGLLPQSPQAMFTKKTVAEELRVSLQIAARGETSEADLEKIYAGFGLTGHGEQHPYDLSGGEMQWLALAKLVLENYDILLLDEPGKGMDYAGKQRMGQYLQHLKEQGKTVVVVSHDVEFAARFADTCGLFFDGHIVSLSDARTFFQNNVFYTTVIQRMCRDVLPEAILLEDVTGTSEAIILEGTKKPARVVMSKEPTEIVKDAILEEKADNSRMAIQKETAETPGGAMQKEIIEAPKTAVPKKIFPFIVFLLLMPITIYIGDVCLQQKKFYFISLVLLLEAMATVFVSYERRKPKLREIMVVAMMTAITVAGRELFYMLPNVKPVAALVILSGVSFGGELGFMIGAMSMLISNIFFGQGPWTPWQMFAMGMLGFFAGVFFRQTKTLSKKKKWGISIFGFISVVMIYGGLINLSSVILVQGDVNMAMMIAALVAGLPFDMIHGMATFAFLLVGARPLLDVLNRVREKYGFET